MNKIEILNKIELNEYFISRNIPKGCKWINEQELLRLKKLIEDKSY